MAENNPMLGKCGVCSKTFASSLGLFKHLRNMHGIYPQADNISKSETNVFVCYVCNQTFTHKLSLVKHLKNRHKFEMGNDFPCSLCSKYYQRKKDLNKHMRQKHLGEVRECDLCGNTYTAKHSLNRHLQRVHQVDMIKVKVVHEDSDNLCCEFCDKSYKSRKDLYQHIRLKHDTKQKTDKDDVSTDNFQKKYNISCHICALSFKSKYNLSHHLRKVHSVAQGSSTSGVCPLCDVPVKNGDNIIAHLENIHEVIVESEKLNFNTFEEYERWRDKMYVETNSQFAKARGVDKVKNGQRIYMNCHHSGKHRSRGIGLRNRNPNKICKRGKVCPARLVVTCTSEGVEVTFYKTHVGHSNDLKYLRLTHSEKEEIAEMLLNDIPHHEIIEKIRSSMPSSRKEVVKMQDLYNIRRDFNVGCMKEILRTHKMSLDISDEMVETMQPNAWNVKSNDEDVYTVVLDADVKCQGCRLLCFICRVCIHQFSCTCKGHLIDGNFCEHIHACVRLQKLNSPDTTADAHQDEEDQYYYIGRKEEIEDKLVYSIPQKVNGPTGGRQNLPLLLKASLQIVSTLDHDRYQKAAPIIKRYIDDIMALKREQDAVKNEDTDHIYSLKRIAFERKDVSNGSKL